MNEACEQYQDALIAFLDNALDEAAQTKLLAHIEQCDACRAEFAWLKQTAADLETIGKTLVEQAPEPNLTDVVMASLPGQGPPPLRVVEHEPGPPRSRHWSWSWVGLAAAAAALVAVYYFGLRPKIAEHDRRKVREARDRAEDAPAKPNERRTNSGSSETTEPRSPEILENLLADMDDSRQKNIESAEDDEFIPVDGPTLTDVLNARRLAPQNEAALSRLTRWATLAPDRARELLASAELPPGALVGASAVLPADEREPFLMTAVGHFPREPYARLELLKASTEREDPQVDVQAELARLSGLDPDNAMPYYFEARYRLEQGDLAGALQVLEHAGQLEGATAYPGKSAQFREQALIESGISPDVARMVVALTAGNEEHGFLYDLGQELLEYGAYFEGQGDLQTAESIYEAVQRFGQQVADGTDYSQERLAGLDLQRAAIDMLGNVYVELGDAEQLEILAQDTEELVAGIAAIRDFFYALNDLFQGNIEEGLARLIGDVILRVGDLNLFDHLP